MWSGGAASMGSAIYENEAVREDGRWKLSVVHAYDTWGGGYEQGSIRNASTYVPGPSADYPPDAPPTFEFSMFPSVYDIPFHYASPADMSAAPGEPGAMPARVAAELYEIGPRIENQRTAAIYAALHADLQGTEANVVRDVAYGPHARHRLDVFAPSSPGAPRAVLVFVHGGGFSRGQKSAPDSPFYDNIMNWAARNDLVGVNINYRLAPDNQWPSGIDDLRSLHAWIEANIADYGGDPNAVFFWGHSAGAAHVGDYIADRVRNGESVGLAGAVLTSGFYDLGREISVWEAYYGDDVALYETRSSLSGLVTADTPLLVNDAELDPASFGQQSRQLVEGRRAAGKPVRYVHLLGHSHLSETYAVGTSDRSLSGPVLEFIRDNR